MILLYHKLTPDKASDTGWWAREETFKTQVMALIHKGYRPVYLDDYNPTANHFCITFDGVYRSALSVAPWLRSQNIPYECFVIGDYVGKDKGFHPQEPDAEFCTLEELDYIVERGGRLQWHGLSHQALTAENIDQELIPTIEKYTSPHFRWFSYPYGKGNEFLPQVSKRFSGAVIHETGTYDRYNLRRDIMREGIIPQPNRYPARISVIVPCYNYGRFLNEAIQSVLNQTRRPDEIIIMDDCSTDDTMALSCDWLKKDSRIRYERNDKNLKATANFDKGVKLSTGDYIVVLDADDRLRTTYIEKLAAILDAQEDIGLVYTDCAVFGEQAREFSEASAWWKNRRMEGDFLIWEYPDYDKKLLEQNNFIQGSSMYRRVCYDLAGGYTRNYIHGKGDYTLWKRILFEGLWSPYYVKEPLLEYRYHTESSSGDSSKPTVLSRRDANQNSSPAI